MVLNIQTWESVRHGEFIVGEWPLKLGNRTLQPGEKFPRDEVKNLQPLFELNKIIPVPSLERVGKKRKRAV